MAPGRGFDQQVRVPISSASATSVPVGGRLQCYLPAWQSIGANPYILEVLREGHTLPFKSGPPSFMGVRHTPLRGSRDKQHTLRLEIQQLLEKGAVEKVPPPLMHMGWYGNYFLVAKKTGGWRPILNLRPLNQILRVDTFKMETLKNVILAVQPGEWLASLDLRDAYFHVPVRQAHWKYLRFCVEGQAYQYKVLPFGLSTSPRIFTKVLAPVISHIRQQGIHIHPYLDDILIRAASPQELSLSVCIAQSALASAGFLVNMEKSQPLPSQDLVYIGGHFLTAQGMVFLPPDRRLALAKLSKIFVAGKLLPAVVWLRLLGVMAATIQVIPQARLRMRHVQMFLLSRWNSDLPTSLPIMVPRSLLPHVQWWSVESNLSQGSPLSPPAHTCVITTDASGAGWGGVLDDVSFAEGVWEGDFLTWHINRLELRAVELTLHHFQHQVQGHSVLVRSDNTATCAYLNKQGGTKSWEMCAQACTLWLWCLDRQITLRAIYIPGLLNVPADALSRGMYFSKRVVYSVDQREWALAQEVATSVFLMLGEPQVDLFATADNTKLPMFCSLTRGQGEKVVDAMSIPWTRLHSFAFPPTVLLPRVISKIIREKAMVLLIAPAWPDRPWFSTLLHLLVEPPVRLPVRQDLLSQNGQYHSNPEFLKLTAWKVSGDPSLGEEFRRKLLRSQSVLGWQAPEQSTRLSGQPSVIGVVRGVQIPWMHL